MKPIEECKTVAELLEAPERWIKGSTVDNYAHPKSFCLLGAIEHIYGDENEEYCQKIRDVLGKSTKIVISLVSFNDNPETTHQQVLEVVRKAGI